MVQVPHLFAINVVILAFGVSEYSMQSECPHCPDGWVYYHESCYMFVDNRSLDWTEATHHCALQHSHLVTVQTKGEDTFLKDYARRLSRGTSIAHYWIGATDSAIEGIWKWYTDDSDLTYTDWYPSQPGSDDAHDEDCVFMRETEDFAWHDGPCDSVRVNFICEKSLQDYIPTGSEIIG